MRNRQIFLTLLLAVIAVPVSLWGQLRPTVTFNKPFAPPKSKVLVSGKNFTPNVSVLIQFDQQSVGQAHTDASGAFTRAPVTILSGTTEGNHGFTVTDGAGISVSVPFLIETDWAQEHFDPQNDANNPYEWKLTSSTVTALKPAWSTTVVPCPGTTAIVAGGVVYYNSEIGGLQALDAANGKLLWSYDMSGNCGTSPTLGAWYTQLIFVNNGAGTVFALNHITHKLAWTYALGGNFPGQYSIAAGNTLFVANGAGRVAALSQFSGKELWNYSVSCPDAGPMLGWNKGVLYVSANECGDLALNASTGSLLWSQLPPGGSGETLESNPLLAYGLVWNSGSNHDPNCPGTHVYGQHISDGTVQFTGPQYCLAEFAADSGLIYSVDQEAYFDNNSDLCATNATAREWPSRKTGRAFSPTTATRTRLTFSTERNSPGLLCGL